MDDFLITGAKVHVLLTELGGKEMTLSLPDIHLTDLGKGGDGLTADRFDPARASEVVTATIKAVTSNASEPRQRRWKIGQGRGQNRGNGPG